MTGRFLGQLMMRAMRAESFTGYGGLKLVEVPRPRRADGRALVRITAAGVTPLDHTLLSGGYPQRGRDDDRARALRHDAELYPDRGNPGRFPSRPSSRFLTAT